MPLKANSAYSEEGTWVRRGTLLVSSSLTGALLWLLALERAMLKRYGIVCLFLVTTPTMVPVSVLFPIAVLHLFPFTVSQAKLVLISLSSVLIRDTWIVCCCDCGCELKSNVCFCALTELVCDIMVLINIASSLLRNFSTPHSMWNSDSPVVLWTCHQILRIVFHVSSLTRWQSTCVSSVMDIPRAIAVATAKLPR